MHDWMTGQEAEVLLIDERTKGDRPNVSHYASLEDALHDLQWGEVGHRVTHVYLAYKNETVTEDEFRALYLPPPARDSIHPQGF
jgi:hypothetical protein